MTSSKLFFKSVKSIAFIFLCITVFKDVTIRMYPVKNGMLLQAALRL